MHQRRSVQVYLCVSHTLFALAPNQAAATVERTCVRAKYQTLYSIVNEPLLSVYTKFRYRSPFEFNEKITFFIQVKFKILFTQKEILIFPLKF